MLITLRACLECPLATMNVSPGYLHRKIEEK